MAHLTSYVTLSVAPVLRIFHVSIRKNQQTYLMRRSPQPLNSIKTQLTYLFNMYKMILIETPYFMEILW